MPGVMTLIMTFGTWHHDGVRRPFRHANLPPRRRRAPHHAGRSARRHGRPPDLVVVPAMPDVGEPTAAPVSAWLRQEAQRGALMLSVCNGSGVLAAAGLLDGRDATAHWIRIGTFEGRFPATHWVRGPRYIDD